MKPPRPHQIWCSSKWCVEDEEEEKVNDDDRDTRLRFVFAFALFVVGTVAAVAMTLVLEDRGGDSEALLLRHRLRWVAL